MARRFLLDRFSELDLRRWKKSADNLAAYHIRLYHHAEGLRYAVYDDILQSLRSPGGIEIGIPGWYRIVDYQYSLEPLSPAGSLIRGGRFNIGADIDRADVRPFPALYIAENYGTAYRERFGATVSTTSKAKMTGAEYALRAPGSFSSVRLKGKLEDVFDLTQSKPIKPFMDVVKDFDIPRDIVRMARRLGITQEQMIRTTTEMMKSLRDQNWRHHPVQFGIPANPQIFGGLLLDAGYTGVLYRSTKGDRRCLAIFPDALINNSSFVELKDNAPKGIQTTRLDKASAPRYLPNYH